MGRQTSKIPIKIMQADIVGDCPRLNRRFELVEGQASTVASDLSTLQTKVATLANSSLSGSGNVSGGENLTDVGRITKVVARGSIGEAGFSDADVVRGAPVLVHAGALTVVDSAGKLKESPGISDSGSVVAITESVELDSAVTKYQNVATYGIGVVPVYASVNLTNQSALINATALQVGGAMAPAGLYHISIYAATHTAGTGGVTITIAFNDGNGSQTLLIALTLNGAIAPTTPYTIYTAGAANITYAVAYTATGSYDLRIRLLSLG